MNPHHVGVSHLARQLELAFEPALEMLGFERVQAVQPDQFESDRHAERVVPGLVDDRHAADAQLADDGVAAGKLLARDEGGRARGQW